MQRILEGYMSSDPVHNQPSKHGFDFPLQIGAESIQEAQIDGKHTLDVDIDPDAEEVFEAFQQRGLTDGLPVIPPTAPRVERMLQMTDRDPNERIGKIPPTDTVGTVRDIAVNAVMAGCRPEYLPVVLACLEAALDPKANLRAALTTTYVSWPSFVINGPVRHQLEVNCSWGLLNSAARANTTIGRAMTLIWTNLGGAVPGLTEKKPQGTELRFTPIIGEYEEESAWESLHVERGYSPQTSTVTVFADYASPEFIWGEAFGYPTFELYRFAQGIAARTYHGVAFGGLDTESFLLFNPTHSRELADDGWEKDDVKRYLYEHARTHRDQVLISPTNPKVPEDVRAHVRVLLASGLPKWAQEQIDSPYITNEMVPVVKRPEDFAIVVAGAPVPQGSKLLFFRGHCTGERSVTRPLTTREGVPITDFNRPVGGLHHDPRS